MPANVSVAIPVYNGDQYLAEAITSVLRQTVPPNEFKVYDNCSTDRSVDVARSLLPGTDVVTSASNRGAIMNFNRAAQSSSPDAQYFAWLAADDRFATTFIERAVDELEKTPQAPACLTGVRFIDLEGRAVGLQTDEPLASRDAAVRLRSFLRRPRWTEFYCLYRREALLSSPLMTADYGTDVLLTWWFLLRWPLAVTSELLLEYRLYPEKTVESMASSLDPTAPRVYWRKRQMWRRLWEMTHSPDLNQQVARTARRELILALGHRSWLLHFTEDVFERWPFTRTTTRRVRHRLRRTDSATSPH